MLRAACCRGGLVLALLLTALPGSQAQLRDGIAAIVEDRVITFSEVKKQVDPTERLLRDTHRPGKELDNKIKEARLNGLRALIERQLIIHEFKKAGFFIPDNIVEERVKDIIREEFDGDRAAFIRTLAANGMSLENYKQEVKDNLIVTAMRQRNVSSAVIVSPYQIEKYYQDNIRQFLQEEQIRVSLVYMRRSEIMEKRTTPKGEVVEVDPNLEQAREILYALDTGSDFAKLARAYSDGTKRDQGGDLGFITKETLRPELASVAGKLKPGQTSRIIETEDGYYILRVTERKKTSVQPISAAREQIEQTLLQEERQRLYQEWIDGLRAKTFVKMF